MADTSTAPSLGRRVLANPVLRRELLERWRGRRAFLVVTTELVVMAVVLLLLYWAGRTTLVDQMRFGNAVPDAGPQLGRFVLDNTFAFAMLFVLFIGPGYAAGQIAGERERKTLGLLQITLVGPWGIVLGKLGAATAWLVLLAVAVIPLGAVGFFLGGAVWADLLRGLAFLVVIAVSVAAMGIGISSVVRRTTAAIVLTYGMVLLLVVGSLFGMVVELVARGVGPGQERVWSLQVNPYLGLADALQSETFSSLPTPLTPFAYVLQANDAGFDDVVVAEAAPEPGGVVREDGTTSEVPLDRVPQLAPVDAALDRRQSREPVWLEVAALYLLFGGLWLAVAARRVGMHGPGGERLVEAAPSPPGTTGSIAPPPPTGAG